MLSYVFPSNSAVTWFALDVAVKATVLLFVVLMLMLGLGRTSAAMRHRIWALTFTALLCLPLLNLLLPGLPLKVIPRQWQTPIVGDEAPAIADAHMPLGTTDDQQAPKPNGSTRSVSDDDADRSMDPATLTGAEQPTMSKGQASSVVLPANAASVTNAQAFASLPVTRPLLTWLFRVWLVGAGVVLLPLAIGILGNRRIMRRGQRLPNTHWRHLLDVASSQLGLRRKATLVFGDPEQMPMTFGWLNPCVVLPSAAGLWSPDRSQIVVLHELAHVKRHDVPIQMLARLACAVYWFHPLIWWGLRRLRLERELACDDCVLLAGQKGSHYASQLLEIARIHHASSLLASAGLSMARQSQLEGRLLAVLDVQRVRTPVGALRSAGLTLAAMIAVTIVGVLRLTVQAEIAKPSATVDSPAATPPIAAKTESHLDGDATEQQMVITGVVLSPVGKPVAEATVEVIAMDQDTGWPVYRTRRQKIGYRSIKTDAAGRFNASVPQADRGIYEVVWIFARAEGFAVLQNWLKPQRTPQDVELRFTDSKTVRVQLIDAIGNPLVGVEPEVWHVPLERARSLWLPDSEARSLVKLWPKCSPSDADGYTTVDLPVAATELNLLVDDERNGCQLPRVKLGGGPMSVVLYPGQMITGKVTAAETGEPLEGAEVVLMTRPFRRARTTADGGFRLASSAKPDYSPDEREIHLNVYPPHGSSYLFKHVEAKRPADIANTFDIPISLRQGIVVEGVVAEEGTGKLVSGASLHFVQQGGGNPFNLGDSRSSYGGTDMQYPVDAEGRFRMPLWSGPGYLFVRAPTPDYVHVMVSDGEKYYGSPGLEREYYDGAVKLDLKPGDTPQPLTIKLRRGVTLSRRVVQSDGKPAGGKAFSRSYLLDQNNLPGTAPAALIKEGLLELPGFAAEASNPLFILDQEHHCGVTVSPTASEIDSASPPIRLQPTGSASFRFVTDGKEPLANYEPRLTLVVTPGAARTGIIERGNPELWADLIIWQNVIQPAKMPKTDAEGRVVVKDLIPGATYCLDFVNKKSHWDQGYQFSVRTGETTDVGEVLISKHD